MSKTRKYRNDTRRQAYDSSTPQMRPTGPIREECKICGRNLYRVFLDPVSKAKYGYGSIMIEPYRVPGWGGVNVNSDGLATFTLAGKGDFMNHRCPERIVKCKYCEKDIRVMHQRPGSPSPMAVVDADLNVSGNVVIDQQGFATNDPSGNIPGPRYRWHDRH